MIPPYVSADWVASHPEATLADVRWYIDGRSGRLAYKAGHLPGAVFIDLDNWLAAPPTPQAGRHPLPDPEVFAAGLRSVGISDDDIVIAYDDDAGAAAGRLVWMLRVTGHQAALLDGGITGWTGPLSTEPPDRGPGTFTARPWPSDVVVDIDAAASADVLVDARVGERFRGEVEPIDARPGHIPGAVNVNCRANVDDKGFLLPDAELRERFSAVDRPWVAYCGSGLTACQNLLVAEHLGLPEGRLYAGSYSQWANTDRPVDTGPTDERGDG